MNRKIFVLFTAAFIASLSISARANNDAKELLLYKIKYGFVNGGKVEYRTQVAEHQDRLVYHTKVAAKTTGLIDQLYKVHDIYESYYDMRTGLPRLAIQNISEGKYRHYDEMTYNQDEFYARSQKKDTTFQLSEPTYDIISAIECLRKMDWSKLSDGETITIPTCYDKEPFPILVVYKGKETLSIGDYKYDCHKFAPVIDPGKIFKKKENMLIWFSDDENKIPVNIRLNLAVGAFKLELDEASVLSHPFTARVSKKAE